MFIIFFTRARHGTLSSARWIQSTPPQLIYLRFILTLSSLLRRGIRDCVLVGFAPKLWRIILKWMLDKQVGVWTGFIWLTIGTSGSLLWTRQWTFVFRKMLGNAWVAEQLLASEDGLIFKELVELVPLLPVCVWRLHWLLSDHLHVLTSAVDDPHMSAERC
jgi:hypothetical protein